MKEPSSGAHVGAGIVGLGEVGMVLARELVASGRRVSCFDGRPAPDHVRRRAEQSGVFLYRDRREFASHVSEVFVAVTGEQALGVAADLSTVLSPDTLYIDCTTKSPSTRDSIHRACEKASLCFGDAALLDSVRDQARPVRMVVSGPGAERAMSILKDSRFLPQIVSYDRPVSAELKLCRSMFTKGQEVLLIETLSAAEALGVRDVVFENLAKTVDRDLRTICDVTVGSSLRYARRRAAEMSDASALASELLGSAPLTEVVAKVFEAIARSVQGSSVPSEGGWEVVIGRILADRLFHNID